MDFYVNDIMRKRCIEKIINNDWNHCFVCGKPSDGEASQWHGRPLCAEENGNRCLRDFEQKLMELEAKRLGLKDEEGLYTRIKPIYKITVTTPKFPLKYPWEKPGGKDKEHYAELVQGDIVDGIYVNDKLPQFIVVEHVAQDIYKQDYLALKDMDTNELIPMFDVDGYMTFIRQATDAELNKYNVWL